MGETSVLSAPITFNTHFREVEVQNIRQSILGVHKPVTQHHQLRLMRVSFLLVRAGSVSHGHNGLSFGDERRRAVLHPWVHTADAGRGFGRRLAPHPGGARRPIGGGGLGGVGSASNGARVLHGALAAKHNKRKKG